MIADGMTTKINPGLMSSVSKDWNTPIEVLNRIRQFDVIGLDPCSNEDSIVDALIEWSLPGQDGLACNWLFCGLVYVNPPYGHQIMEWVRKMVNEASCGAEIIALVPARTDAAWWQNFATQARAICFWRGRLRFLGADSSAPFPSAVLYWGDRVARFKEVFQSAGWVV